MRRDSGFVMPVVLVVVALVLIAAGGCLALAFSSASTAVADDERERVVDGARLGLTDLLEAMRWGWVERPADGDPSLVWCEGLPDGVRVEATVQALVGADAAALPAGSPVSPTSCRSYRASVTAVRGTACSTLSATCVETADGLCRGLVVGGDADLLARVELVGCGLEAGGDVNGREEVTLTSPPTSAVCLPDLAYGGLHDGAGVHAAGDIFLCGVEEHAGGSGIDGDGDRHMGVAAASAIVAGPSAATIATLVRHAEVAESPLRLDSLALGPAVSPPEDPALPGRGRLVVVRPSSGACLLRGTRPTLPAACPLTLLVLGDAVVDDEVALTGALVVTGSLVVRAPLTVVGSVFAGDLSVFAPLSVDFSKSGGQEYAPGVSKTQIASWNA